MGSAWNMTMMGKTPVADRQVGGQTRAHAYSEMDGYGGSGRKGQAGAGYDTATSVL